MRLTAPSTRNSASCRRRAPSPRRSRSCLRVADSMKTSRSMSSVCEMGSAKCRSADSAATGRRGVIASSTRPSAWSRRRMSLAPKRRTSGARGAVSTEPTVLSPTLSRLALVSRSRRSAVSGKGDSAAASSPGSTGGNPNRAAAQATPGVEPRPPRASKPCSDSRQSSSSSAASSPPNKWAQPVMSR